MIVKRRTFDAAKWPKGSQTRAALNLDPLTSEYMPSYRYVVRNDDGTPTPFAYRTKAEATARAAEAA